MTRARAVPATASTLRSARRTPPPVRGRLQWTYGDAAPEYCPPSATVTAAASTPVRVTSVVIKDNTFQIIHQRAEKKRKVYAFNTGEAEAVLWGLLDLCVVPAEQRARAHFGCDNNIPAALMMIVIRFPFPANAAILGPLTTDYPMLVRSLRVLKIIRMNFDDDSVLGAFSALATQLQELSFVIQNRSLTSLHSLAGRCQYLRTVDFSCCLSLSSLDGLEHHLYLEEIRATSTSIASVEPLGMCPALTTVDLNYCHDLSTLNGLEDHQHLQWVSLSHSAVTAIDPLRTCPALTTVKLYGCWRLSSIEALAGHQHLQSVDARCTAVTSIKNLRRCPALTEVSLSASRQLSPTARYSIGGLTVKLH